MLLPWVRFPVVHIRVPWVPLRYRWWFPQRCYFWQPYALFCPSGVGRIWEVKKEVCPFGLHREHCSQLQLTPFLNGWIRPFRLLFPTAVTLEPFTYRWLCGSRNFTMCWKTGRTVMIVVALSCIPHWRAVVGWDDGCRAKVRLEGLEEPVPALLSSVTPGDNLSNSEMRCQ